MIPKKPGKKEKQEIRIFKTNYIVKISGIIYVNFQICSRSFECRFLSGIRISHLTGSVLSSASFATNNSQVKIEFPKVTKSILIINATSSNTPLRIHFNSLDEGNVEGGKHFVTLPSNRDSIKLEHKCKEIYISLETAADGAFELVADLTGIDSNEMIALTGSGLTD